MDKYSNHELLKSDISGFNGSTYSSYRDIMKVANQPYLWRVIFSRYLST